MSMKLMRIESDVEKHRYNLFRIRTYSKTELMDRTLLAIKHKPVRLLISQKFICDIIISLSTVNPVYDSVYLLLAYLL